MSVFLTAVGLVLILEGMLYGVFPAAAKHMAKLLEETPEQTIQAVGIGAALLGLVIIWLSRA